MSLDVTLYGDTTTVKCVCDCCYNEHEREETECLFDANVTHNLNTMADKAGIYHALWRPEEIGATRAKDITMLLEAGLADLKERPDYFKQFNPDNRWGSYDGFVLWVENYYIACVAHPEATISISR